MPRRLVEWLIVLLLLAGYSYLFLFPERALLIVDKLTLLMVQ
jgi:hypothetical protein